MSRNNQSNLLIKRLIIFGDYVFLNMVVLGFCLWQQQMSQWSWDKMRIFFLVCNMALLLSQSRFHTIIHRRIISGGEVLKRVVLLVSTQTVLAYFILKIVDYNLPVGWHLLKVGTFLMVFMIMARVLERYIIKWYRQMGGNTRTVMFVGNDMGIEAVKEKMKNDPTLGYQILSEHKDVTEFVKQMDNDEGIDLVDELFLCVPVREKEIVRKVSTWCDLHVISFYYIPMSVEALSINLKRETLDDIDIYTTYEIPLQNPINSLLKRTLDIIVSTFFLIFVLMMLPFIALCIKLQSPGPIFFRQLRTGLDGRSFTMYKFRSMHVNKDANRVQASKDDPRKFPFGNFMRKVSIDELPQLWNVLKGDMSIVGPRPHMLAHTEMYSQLIDKYMVRHFVKPGITGWSQVSGFRGETKELWQMEGRVIRDIWYIEHWSIWLDFRIIWLTVKAVFISNKNAY